MMHKTLILLIEQVWSYLNRRRALALALALAVLVPPGATWACSPGQHGYETPTRSVGEAGEVIWHYGAFDVARLSPAEDIGGGFAVQDLTDGTGCYGEAYTIVQNCATGEAVAFGGEAVFAARIIVGHTGVLDVLEELNELLRERARIGDPLSIAEISAEAQVRGVESVVPMRTDSHLRQGEGEFQLGVACRMFYPDMSPNPEQ